MSRIVWDEAKRAANLAKHGLDFALSEEVLSSRFRLDIETVRGSEHRIVSIAYVLGVLAVLTLVHTVRGDTCRVISLRRASREERGFYEEWLENECDEP